MANTGRMTISLPLDLASAVNSAVERGDYASPSEVIREALRDWKMKRALQMPEFAAIRADIEKGLAGLGEGRRKNPKATGKVARAKKPSPRQSRRR